MNTVDVDPVALAAEADAIAAANAPAAIPAPGVPEVPGEPTAAQVEATARGYEAGAVILVAGAARVFAPAWNITATESQELGRAIALAAAHWFPDGALPPKWMALLNVAAIGVGIVAARQDADGRLRPLKHAGGAPAPAGQGSQGATDSATNAAGGAKLPEY